MNSITQTIANPGWSILALFAVLAAWAGFLVVLVEEGSDSGQLRFWIGLGAAACGLAGTTGAWLTRKRTISKLSLGLGCALAGALILRFLSR